MEVSTELVYRLGAFALNLEKSPQDEMRKVLIFFFKRCICFCFMFIGVLFACKCIVCMQYTQRPAEGIGFPGTQVTNVGTVK